MNTVALILQLVSGAVGGNLAGAILKKYSFGPVLNSVLGILGGGLGGQLLNTVLGTSVGGGGAGGLDLITIIQSVASGGVGGGVVMVIAGLIRQILQKK